MRPFILIVFFLFLFGISNSQDIRYAKWLIDSLSAPGMHGRGYVANGDRIAANFLAGEFANMGLLSFSQGYKQPYSFTMNTLPGKLEVALNDKKLNAGSDFQVWAASPDLKGTFKIVLLNQEILQNNRKLMKFFAGDFNRKFILIDKKGISDKKVMAILDSIKYYNFLKAPGLIFINDTKLTGSVMIGFRQRSYTVIDLKRDALPKKLKSITCDIESEFVPDHKTANVIGWIKGQAEPDSFLVFTAHYDHLGRMGSEVYYPGANDNASGTAMVTDLARHYSAPENRPRYSMAFILLSGEEAGLLGAKYCAEHPPFPLKKIKFLVNLDMVGTGSEGITMVNATKFNEAYNRMVKINADNEYILTVKERGESCNSDHCPFYEKGVPAVFIYSMGKEFTEYHNPDDQSNKLPLSEYNDIFRLMKDFMDSFRE